jgi:hypothetical protein
LDAWGSLAAKASSLCCFTRCLVIC